MSTDQPTPEEGQSPPPRRRRRVSLDRKLSQSGIAAELLGLLETATEDGVISDEEAGALQTWLDDNKTSDLPGIEFLRTTVNHILADGKITQEERRELHKAVERLLPPDLRRVAKERRTAVQNLEKATKREEKEQERQERALRRPITSANFMVAGVTYEGRADVVEDYVEVGDSVYLVRDPDNEHDRNAIEIRVRQGFQIGFVPREDAGRLALLLDAGHSHQAHVTKILHGRRAPIPVVQIHIYHYEAEIDGAVTQDEIPSPAKPSTAAAGNSPCTTCITVVFGLMVVAVLFLWIKC